MLARAIRIVLWALTVAAILATFLLQNYARISCHWRWTSKDTFLRMVVFADPQMEGDSKIERLGKRGMQCLCAEWLHLVDFHILHVISIPPSAS
jgi:hypothetical protein